MKANIALEIDKDDLNYELENLVSSIAAEEIKKMVRKKAEALVEQEVKKIIGPIVDSYLNKVIIGEEFASIHSNRPSRTEVDRYIKRVLQDYLDEPCFTFNKDSNELAKRYMKSSSRGERTTRAERWVMDKTREFADKELFAKIESQIEKTVKTVIPTDEQIQEIIKKEIQQKFS